MRIFLENGGLATARDVRVPGMHSSPTLAEPTIAHMRELMTWFPDAQSLRAWGGPGIRFPFTERTFLSDAGWGSIDSAILQSSDVAMIGFGQTWEKLGRGHLARLAVSPSCRGRGYGPVLVRSMMHRAAQTFHCTECSLYVYRDNEPALRCYRSTGFREAEDPDPEGRADALFMVASIDQADYP